MFPSGNVKPDRRNRFARVVSVAKAVFMWLRTGEVQRHEMADKFPARKRVAGQTTQPEGRTAGH
jgi:hypothetical protein